MPEYTKKDFGGFDLSELFTYDPDTGIVRHNPDRPAESFSAARSYKHWLTRFSGKGAGAVTGSGYLRAETTIGGRRYFQYNHRIALYLSGIVIPSGLCVDHIDGDPSNNRLDNLRVVTHQNNAKNQKTPSNNTSGVIGVIWVKGVGKWRARVMVEGKLLHLGYYEDKDEAIRVRKEAEVKYGFHPNHGRD